jgi:hypothetical protein
VLVSPSWRVCAVAGGGAGGLTSVSLSVPAASCGVAHKKLNQRGAAALGEVVRGST